jgi:peptidoglycan L-alanyl-D-glutamate endopeptidase CwlK
MLGAVSLRRLGTCHPKLQALIIEVDRRLSVRKLFDLTVVCGHRGKEEQEQALRDGNSDKHWPDSRHNQVPATAVDVAPYPIDWDDGEMFMLLVGYILAVADDMGIEVELGALWKKRDRPHIQLSLRELAKAA